MVMHPEVQVKAQAELDSVLGAGHLPSYGDEELLPYLMSIVKECLRWEIASPFGIPHMSTEADEYKGYTIPSGSLIIPNGWCLYHHPSSRHAELMNRIFQGGVK